MIPPRSGRKNTAAATVRKSAQPEPVESAAPPAPEIRIGTFTWECRSRDMPWVRIGRWQFDAQSDSTPHYHDYAEFMWVLDGAMTEKVLDGESRRLGVGDVSFLPPGSGHQVLAADPSCFFAVASFPPSLFAEFQQRYAGSDGWPWREKPTVVHLASDRLRALESAASEVPEFGQERADAEWFAASLVRILRAPIERAAIPGWLAETVRWMETPTGLLAGVTGMFKHSRKAPATVSRAVRRYYGCTASALVMRSRIEQSAQLLRQLDQSIIDISMQCGFKDLSHYYHAFKSWYGVTPKVWRSLPFPHKIAAKRKMRGEKQTPRRPSMYADDSEVEHGHRVDGAFST